MIQKQMFTDRITCPDCKGKKYRSYPTKVIGTDEPASIIGTCGTCGFKGYLEVGVPEPVKEMTQSKLFDETQSTK